MEGTATMETPRLQVAHLSKSFTIHALGGRHMVCLDDVSFDVGPGEHLAIAGSSGAGKSSLIRCIHRTYLPDAGSITLATDAGPVELVGLPDRAMARLRGRQLSYVSQFMHAPPRTGPLQVVTAAARRSGIAADGASDAAAASLQRLGLPEELWHHDCAVLSGGERQRINLAAGLVGEPQLLLLDEPVSALDPENAERALQAIEGLRERQVSVVAIYHDMTVIRRVADRMLLLDRGRVADVDAPDAVLAAGHHALKDHV